MKILNLNKQWPSKKYSEIFDLGWEKLTLSERDKEYSPSSAIGGNYEPFIKRYLSESALARSKVNSKRYKYGNKENQILEISCSNSSHSKSHYNCQYKCRNSSNHSSINKSIGN